MNKREQRIAKRAERERAAETGTDVPATVDVPVADVPADVVADVPAVIETAPATVPTAPATADVPTAPADVPADVPAPVIDRAAVALGVLADTFPGVTMPGFVRPYIAGVLAGIDTPADASDATLIGNIARAMETAAPGVPMPSKPKHARYAGGVTIAVAQNGLYVVAAACCMLAATITNRIGMALWRVECPGGIDYMGRTYWTSTRNDYIVGRHNDTPGFPDDAARAFVRAWVNRKPGETR